MREKQQEALSDFSEGADANSTETDRDRTRNERKGGGGEKNESAMFFQQINAWQYLADGREGKHGKGTSQREAVAPTCVGTEEGRQALQQRASLRDAQAVTVGLI